MLLFFVPIFGYLIKFLIFPFIAYNAYNASPVRREANKKWIFMIIFGSIVIPLTSIPLAIFIRTFIVEARWIPSVAMIPTLQINDRLTIDKLSYKFFNPQRGDIIVFLPTEQLRKEQYSDAFIKRIIGLPGDKVELKAGMVYINNKPLSEKYLTPEQRTSIDVCTSGTAPYLVRPVTVPSNSYLTLGDNRHNSYDSRCWGVVPKSNIIGKATKIFWPFKRIRAF